MDNLIINIEECMKNPIIGYLVDMSTATTTNATTVFNMFLTVIFGSFAFAAAIPLKNIGKSYFNLSTSSLWVGFSLLSFYIISYLSFSDSVRITIVAIKNSAASDRVLEER